MKKNKRFFPILIFVFSIGIFSGCSVYKPVTFGDVQNIKLKGISADGVDFEVYIPVQNPNSFSVTLLNYNFDIAIEDVVGGTISNAEEMTIAPKSDSVQKFRVKAQIKNIFTGLTAVYRIFNGQQTEIHFKGNARIKALFFPKTIEIDQKQLVDISK